ncbi:macrolide ABC transporter ATP-binding protein [Paenibacillus elgii]|uniref:Macrolide ABC transporter ATP-binding protein n=1 Tax=Paenibacillus elgii TaxID=189691 RepID=A0A165RD10_9BACL|nr:ABC transporter permease [Paenibacillus elgii]KZE80862.1 macrolide ABC transporter ATP-binding protein [Paenibacillus elgii]MCM3268766.1 ABC transporter permease [Paenibacillus elgii]
MRTTELITMALRTVLSNPMRTMLTMLGVIIGVSSVVTLVAIGRGTSDQIEKQYENLGTNMLVVNVLGTGRAQQLDYNDLMQLEQLPEFSSIAPTINKANSNIKYDRTQEKYTVTGTNDRYLSIMKGQLETGRFIVDADLEFRNPVAVLGSEVSKTYFGTLDPTGEQINIDGVVFTVVGKLKSKGTGAGGTSMDNAVFVPLTTAQRTFKLGNIRTTYIDTPTKEDIYKAQDTMKQYLTYKFKSDQGFNLINQDELMNARVAASSTLTNQLISVACISLLVGGIGIMNIMLVTVSERTREIGIRKSIGAKRRNILMQFLVEATVISGIGGLIGLLLGSGLALVWPMINPSQTTKLSMDIGLYAFLFSVLVGVVFGLYPANKASKLRPIDALRFD